MMKSEWPGPPGDYWGAQGQSAAQWERCEIALSLQTKVVRQRDRYFAEAIRPDGLVYAAASGNILAVHSLLVPDAVELMSVWSLASELTTGGWRQMGHGSHWYSYVLWRRVRSAQTFAVGSAAIFLVITTGKEALALRAGRIRSITLCWVWHACTVSRRAGPRSAAPSSL